MTKLVVELDLETVISFSEDNEAAILAAANHIRNNWFEFIEKHKDDLKVNVLCEIGS